jgi:hypothetical protein
MVASVRYTLLFVVPAIRLPLALKLLSLLVIVPVVRARGELRIAVIPGAMTKLGGRRIA